MTDPTANRRRFCPTPAWLVLGLLLVEGLLWLSERFQWFGFNEKKGWTVLIAVTVVGVAMLVMLLWFIVALVFRWRFQFSIRSLLILTVVVAIPCSWLAAELKAAREQRAVVAEIKSMNLYVTYDWEVDADGRFHGNAKPHEPTWLLNLLGEDFFRAVVQLINLNPSYGAHINDPALEGISICSLWLGGTPITDSGLEYLTGLTQLQSLNLNSTQVTDKGLGHLKGLTALQSLDLGYTRLTDTGLQHLAGMSRLHTLNLSSTQVTDEGLGHLKGLTKLQSLGLRNTQITDTGLQHLAGLTELHTLDLRNTQVTNAGMEHLAGLTQLRELNLYGTKVSDAGLRYFKGLTQLNQLNLRGTKVTDAGMVELKGSAQLRWLSLKNTQVTKGAVLKLLLGLPNCGIER